MLCIFQAYVIDCFLEMVTQRSVRLAAIKNRMRSQKDHASRRYNLRERSTMDNTIATSEDALNFSHPRLQNRAQRRNMKKKVCCNSFTSQS